MGLQLILNTSCDLKFWLRLQYPLLISLPIPRNNQFRKARCWWRWWALTLSRALLAPEDEAGDVLLSPMPLLLLLLLILLLLLLLLQTTLFLCQFLLLLHGLELLLKLRNAHTARQQTEKYHLKAPVNFCSIYFAGMGCSPPIICCCYTISPCRLILYSLWKCPVQYWPWGVPGAEPGADGSTFHAASGTHWWVAVSGSAAASEWGAAPAAAASPTALGPSLAPASSGQCAGLAVIRAPRSAARPASRPLRPTKWIADSGKEKNRFLWLHFTFIDLNHTLCFLFFGDEEDEIVVKPWKREKIKNDRGQCFLSCDPQKHVIIIASINKHWIAFISTESSGSSCATNSMDIWHEMLKWPFKVITEVRPTGC